MPGVKESVREIAVCGLPSSKASRIPERVNKRAAVVGRCRGQTGGNYEARRDSRNGREVILLDLARGGGNGAIHHRSAVLPGRLPIGHPRDLHAARTGTGRGIEIPIGDLSVRANGRMCVRVFLSGS